PDLPVERREEGEAPGDLGEGGGDRVRYRPVDGVARERGSTMPPGIDMAAIKALPIDERIALVTAIWDTIAEEEDKIELTEAQKAELQRRLDLYRANPDKVIPWEVVKAEATARSKK